MNKQHVDCGYANKIKDRFMSIYITYSYTYINKPT